MVLNIKILAILHFWSNQYIRWTWILTGALLWIFLAYFAIDWIHVFHLRCGKTWVSINVKVKQPPWEKKCHLIPIILKDIIPSFLLTTRKKAQCSSFIQFLCESGIFSSFFCPYNLIIYFNENGTKTNFVLLTVMNGARSRIRPERKIRIELFH